MKPERNGAFLTRLARDTRGNVLAIMAAAFFPLVGLIGGGVDMTRMYIAKARLQQACDAGALAGRKVMAAGSWTTSGTDSSRGRANEMFRANFASGDFGTEGLNREFTESDGTVTGVASVEVPMTLMKIFGKPTQDVSVTCTAKMEIPNTDVMFVLDVTSSMNCEVGCAYSATERSDAKIKDLRSAVKCFYEALLKVDTSEVCGTNDPAATTYAGTAQIRLGFVPYAVNVNVGKLLPNSLLADDWDYQTRQGVFYEVEEPVPGDSYNESEEKYSRNSCENWAIGDDTTGFPSASSAPDSFTVTTDTYTFVSYTAKPWWEGGGGTCTRTVNQSEVTYTRDDANGTYFHTWIYDKASIDVSGLKADGLSLRIGEDGEYTDVSWDGCIEELPTYQNTDGDPSDDWEPVPDAALDMRIDPPSGSQWGPLLPDVFWGRYEGSGWGAENTLDTVVTDDDLDRNMSDGISDGYYCPAEARKLAEYDTPVSFESYISGLEAHAIGTYHDIGLLWGGRLISPTGIFGSENALTEDGGAIERHVIFMTDGDARTYENNLNAYGSAWWDRRQTSYAPDSGELTDLVNARTEALCTQIKNMNIQLWVVSYGDSSAISDDNEQRLSECASPGHYLKAQNRTALISKFQQIASEIADLRLTQ